MNVMSRLLAASIVLSNLLFGSTAIAGAGPPPTQMVPDAQSTFNWCTENPHVMGTGDFNGDGLVDLYCHSLATGSTWIAYAAATRGGPVSFVGYGAPIGLTGWCYGGTAQFGALDIDGNGLTDFYCHDTGAGGVQWIATNVDGRGTFRSTYQFANWCGPGYTFTITDWNGDGRSDALCYVPSAGNVYIATSNGMGWGAFGSLELKSFCAGTGGNLQFGVADFNNDQKIDVFCHDFNSGSTSISLSNGAGFSNPTNWMTGWCIGGQGFGIGDFNGDHYTDVWCFNQGNYTVGINWAPWPVLFNAGNFASGYCNSNWAQSVLSDKGTRFVTRAPHTPSLDSLFFNGDAKTDVACRDNSYADVTGGLTDNADSRFVATDLFRTDYSFCGFGATLLTGDFNGDGTTDMACTTSGTTKVHHAIDYPLEYQGGAIMSGPVTLDLIFYGNHWGPTDYSVFSNFASSLSGSAYWNIMSRFHDGSGHTVPSTFNTTYDYVYGYPQGVLMGWSEIYALISSLHPVADPNTVYVVLFDNDSSTAGYGTDGGAHGMGGAYHAAWVGNPANSYNGNMSYCVNSTISPNNAPAADCMIPVLVHEFAESLTDPVGGTGWIVNPSTNTETGDMCNGWWINLLQAPNGSSYTLSLNGSDYLVPSLAVPVDSYTTFCGYHP